MVMAVGNESRGWSYLVRGLKTPLIGLIHQWGLNPLALLGSFLLLPLFPRIIHAIAELTYAPIAWRL